MTGVQTCALPISFNGQIPGPRLHIRQGDRVRINVRNRLPESTTVHWHGMILPNVKIFFVTFLDHGTVEQSVEIKNYRVSAGFGFRINVPQLSPLPIALDFAFPINKAPWDNRQLFSFYVGVFGGP